MRRELFALAWVLLPPLAELCEAAAPAPSSLTRPATAPTTSVDPAHAEQLAKWVRYLTEENTLTTRKTACADMLAAGWPDAVDALVEVLSHSPDAAAKLAICETIAADKSPPAAFIEALRSLLDNADTRLRDAAAAALGSYRNGNVVRALAEDLKNPNAPIARRVASVQALTYVRDVAKAIDVLVASLDDPDKRIRSEVAAALPRLAPVDFGTDAAAWRQWWKNDRADLLNGLSSRLRRQERQQEVLETRYLDLLGALFAKTPEAQRDVLLFEWFKSAFPVERRSAVTLVHERLRDGKLPSASVASAIRKLVDDPDVRVRREVILLIRDLRQPEDTSLLLGRLEQERDRVVRPAIYSALGRLGSVAAMPACIAGLNDPNEDVVAEAVTALGWLVQQQRESAGADVGPAVEATWTRFQVLPAAPDLRERVVDAMAKMKDARFTLLLRHEAGEDESSAAVRVAAVRGLGLLCDAANIDVVAARLTDKDAGVREAAVKAMGELGTTSEHLKRLATQLDPTAEPVKAIQAFAWESYRAVFARLSTQEELDVLKELNGQSDPVAAERFVQLITSVEQKLATMSPAPPELPGIRAQMGDALSRINRDGDAAAAYEKALPLMTGASAEKRHEVYLKRLRSLLRAGLADTAIKLVTADREPSGPGPDAIAQTFVEHVESLLAANKPDAAIELLDKLQPAGRPVLGLGLASRLKDLRRDAVQLQRTKDRENIQKWMTDLKSGGEAAANASVMIRQLGTRAIGPLKAEVKKTLSNNGPKDPALERLLVDLLKQLVPGWSGYSPESKTEDKLKALQMLPEAA